MCATGNPSADTRTFRKAAPHDPNQRPWMIVKQMKHSAAAEAPLTYDAIYDFYDTFKKRLGVLVNDYRIMYILVTNRALSDDILAKVHTHEGIDCTVAIVVRY